MQSRGPRSKDGSAGPRRVCNYYRVGSCGRYVYPALVALDLPKEFQRSMESKSKCLTYERNVDRRSRLEHIKHIKFKIIKRQDKNCAVYVSSTSAVCSVAIVRCSFLFWLLLVVDISFVLKFFHPPSVPSREKRERERKGREEEN